MEGGRSGGRKSGGSKRGRKGWKESWVSSLILSLNYPKQSICLFLVTVIVPNNTVWVAGETMRRLANETVWRQARPCTSGRDLVEAGEMLWRQATLCRARRHYVEAGETMRGQAWTCGCEQGRRAKAEAG